MSKSAVVDDLVTCMTAIYVSSFFPQSVLYSLVA